MDKETQKRIGIVGITVGSRQESAAQVNRILSEHGDIIVARVGLPYRERRTHVITVVIDATNNEVGALTGKLGMVRNVKVKSMLL